MKKIRLTESDLNRIVKRVIKEQDELPDEMYSRKSAPKGIENQVLRMIQYEVESIADDSTSSYEFDERINELLMSWDDEIEKLSEREYQMLMRFIEDVADAVEEVIYRNL